MTPKARCGTINGRKLFFTPLFCRLYRGFYCIAVPKEAFVLKRVVCAALALALVLLCAACSPRFLSAQGAQEPAAQPGPQPPVSVTEAYADTATVPAGTAAPSPTPAAPVPTPAPGGSRWCPFWGPRG